MVSDEELKQEDSVGGDHAIWMDTYPISVRYIYWMG